MFNLKLWDRAKSSPIVESEKANSYMWLYASGADSLNGNIPDSVIPNIVLYDYHNSRAERAIKPFVIGRKNWLFSQTATGANASAVLYSIIETAKSNCKPPLK